MSEFDVESAPLGGGPVLTFHFHGDTCRAEMEGAVLYAEGGRRDGGVDLRLTDASGKILAEIVVMPFGLKSMTENVVDIGSALLWSHSAYLRAVKG